MTTSLIWAPEDCHVIEFASAGAIHPGRDATMIAQWSKTTKGEMVRLETKKDEEGRLLIATKDVLNACKFFHILI